MGVVDSFEKLRVDRVYSLRNYDTDSSYSDINSVYLHRVQSIERVMLSALKKTCLDQKLSTIKVLDYGCGNGRWFGRWLAWGVPAKNLFGVDLRETAVENAKHHFSAIDIHAMCDGIIPFPDNYFDIVTQNLVFSSILDDQIRQATAVEMIRVLKPGGFIFWFDFTFNNPTNPDVNGIVKKDIIRLFSSLSVKFVKKLVLAPPIAKYLVPLSWNVSSAIEAFIPIFRTHIFVALKK